MPMMKPGWLAGTTAFAVLSAFVVTTDLNAQGLKLTGYADLEWVVEETGDSDDEWRNFFDNHHFNLIGVGWVTEDLGGAIEIEYEHAGEEIALEYGYIAYYGIPHLRLVGGKFIVPFNRWNKDIHPTFISKMPGRPLVYSNVFPSTYSDVGVWASGAGAIGEGSRVTYDVYVVNGLKGDPDATSFRGLRDNDRDRPNDDNKAVGGRLGVELRNVGLGVSTYSGDYAQDEADGLGLTFLGVDADVHWEGLELRGEYVSATQDLSDGTEADRSGYYLQAAYLTAANFEPVIRFSSVDFEGKEDDTSELGVGFSYYLSSSGAIRMAYYFNTEEDEFEKDNDKLMTQFVVVF